MKLLDFLHPKAVSANLKAVDKEGAIRELADLLLKAGAIQDENKEPLVKILLNREALGSTGIGQNIGIPHGKTNCVKKLVGAFGVSKRGINFDSLDGEPVYLFFLLVAPEDSAGPHLKALARISRILKDQHFRQILRDSKDEKEILRIFKEEDEKKG